MIYVVDVDRISTENFRCWRKGRDLILSQALSLLWLSSITSDFSKIVSQPWSQRISFDFSVFLAMYSLRESMYPINCNIHNHDNIFDDLFQLKKTASAFSFTFIKLGFTHTRWSAVQFSLYMSHLQDFACCLCMFGYVYLILLFYSYIQKHIPLITCDQSVKFYAILLLRCFYFPKQQQKTKNIVIILMSFNSHIWITVNFSFFITIHIFLLLSMVFLMCRKQRMHHLK